MTDVDGLLERLKWCIDNRSTEAIFAASIETGVTSEGDDIGWLMCLPSRIRDRQVGYTPKDAAVLAISWNNLPQIIAAIEQQRTEFGAVSAELAEHKRRLLEQSAMLNSVRQERDRAIDDAITLLTDFSEAVRNEHNDGLKVHHSVRVKMCLHNADEAVKHYEELKRKAGCE